MGFVGFEVDASTSRLAAGTRAAPRQGLPRTPAAGYTLTIACLCGQTSGKADLRWTSSFYDVFVPADDTGLRESRHAEVEPE